MIPFQPQYPFCCYYLPPDYSYQNYLSLPTAYATHFDEELQPLPTLKVEEPAPVCCQDRVKEEPSVKVENGESPKPSNLKMEKQESAEEHFSPVPARRELCRGQLIQDGPFQVLDRRELERRGIEDLPKRNKSETKNLIKNYGRAMLSFMTKNVSFRRKVLRSLKMSEPELMEAIQEFRHQIHTISGIRYLWQHHPMSKPIRIMCCEYLRKHNLRHVFNSRVMKYGVYLRYQEKIMRSMEKPHDFESIKDF